MSIQTAVIFSGTEGSAGMTGTAGGTGMNVTGPQGPISNELGPQGEMGPTGLTGPSPPSQTGPTGPMNSVTSTSTVTPTISTTNNFDSTNFAFVNTASQSDTPNPYQYEWIRHVNNGVGNNIVVDSKGYIYFMISNLSPSNPAIIYGNDMTTFETRITIAGTTDICIVKYDPFGNYQYTLKIATNGSADVGNTIQVDKDDNLYVTGDFGSTSATTVATITIFNKDNSVNTVMSTYTGQDSFLAKYSSTGTFNWLIRFGSSNLDNLNNGAGIVFDSQNNLYFTYRYRNLLNFVWGQDGTTVVTTRSDNTTIEESLMKFDSNGNFVWAVRMGVNDQTRDLMRSIAIDRIDGQEFLYVAGNFQGTTTSIYNPNDTTIQTQFNQVITTGDEGILMKFTTDGMMVWYLRVSGADTVGLINGILTDSLHNIYVHLGESDTLATIYGTNESGIQTSVSEVTTGMSRGRAMVKFDQNGVFVKVIHILEMDGLTRGKFTFIDPDDNLYAALLSSTDDYQIYGSDFTNVITFLKTTNIDPVVTKWTSNGEFVWSMLMGSPGNENFTFGAMCWVDQRQNVYSIMDYATSPAYIYGTDNTSIQATIPRLATSTNRDVVFVKTKQYNTIYLHDGSNTELQKVLTNSTQYRVYIDCTFYTTVYDNNNKVNCIQLTSTGSNCVLYWDVNHNVWRYSHGIGNKVILNLGL